MATSEASGGRAAFVLGLVAAALFVLGPAAAFIGLASAMTGFGIFGLAGLLALITVLIAAGTMLRSGFDAAKSGLAIGATMVILFMIVAMPGCGVPRINDITTDMANPPAFVHAGTIAANQGRDMSYPGESFAAQQRDAYPEVAPLTVAQDPAVVFATVERTVRATPRWEVTRLDAERRELEGVETSRVFRFKDDFIVQVQSGADGGSVVQMRSKSRDGKSDIGANAARIEQFFTRLRAELDAG